MIYDEHWVKKLSICSCIELLISKKIPEIFLILSHLDFPTQVSPKVLIDFFLRGLSQTLSISVGKFNHTQCFSFVQWNPEGLEMPENGISLDRPRYSNFFSVIFVSFSHQGVNQYVFTWGGLFWLYTSWKYSLHWNRNPDWPKMAKVLLVYSTRYINSSFSKSMDLNSPFEV